MTFSQCKVKAGFHYLSLTSCLHGDYIQIMSLMPVFTEGASSKTKNDVGCLQPIKRVIIFMLITFESFPRAFFNSIFSTETPVRHR